MGLKRLLRSVGGIFVELPPEMPGDEPQKISLDDVVRQAPGPNLDQVSFRTVPAANNSDGSLDLARIYSEAGVAQLDASDARLLTSEEVIDKLAQLPGTMPTEQRRQTLGMILEALGQSPRDILADAALKIEALGAYEDAHQQQVLQQSEQTEQEIAALTAQIEEKRQALQDARAKHQQVVAECERESERLKQLTTVFAADAAAPAGPAPARPSG